MNAEKLIGVLVPLVVWKRLQRRKTRTMITTQRSAVFTVEFNESASKNSTRCVRRAVGISERGARLRKFYGSAAQGFTRNGLGWRVAAPHPPFGHLLPKGERISMR